MAVVELGRKDEIAAFFRRNPRSHVYEIGDLDDFDWPHTRWYGWEHGERLEQVALLYSEPAVPVLLAIAEEPLSAMEDLLRAVRDSLPPELYVHVTAPLLDALAERYSIEGAAPHLKLALARNDLLGDYAAPVELLGSADLDEIEAFYAAAYPGTWFAPRMLATGRYVGIRDGRPARLRRRSPRPLAGLRCGRARQRGDAPLAPWTRAGTRRVCLAVRAPPEGRNRDDRPQRPRRQRRGDRIVCRARVRAGRGVRGSEPQPSSRAATSS